MGGIFYFIEPTGYNKYISAAAEGSDIAMVFRGFRNKMEERLFKWHNSWPLNKRHELPFKSFWTHKYTADVPVGTEYILMAESFHLSYSRAFLLGLKNKFPKTHLCFVFSNPAVDYNVSKVKSLCGLYDAIITFAKEDAQKYGFSYCDVLPMKLPAPTSSMEVRHDIFFVGKNKGRLDKIYEIYDKLHSLGLKCLFYIVGVPEEQQRHDAGLIYNTPITYEQVLTYVQQSRCVLEILQEDCHYVSIKTLEALHYHKKLLTTNVFASESPLYDEHVIRIAHTMDDIDKEFIINEVSEEVYDSIGLVESYQPLYSYLKDLL